MQTKPQASSTGAQGAPSPSSSSCEPSISSVLFNVPNTVTYSRVLLLFWAAAVARSQPGVALALWLVNFALDGADGALARRLGQTSAFGAFLDVAVDIASRGMLWVSWAAAAAADAAATAAASTYAAAPAGGGAAAAAAAVGMQAGTAAALAAVALPLSLAVILLECLVFTCTHAAAGAAWKQESHFSAAPAWVAAVMSRGFKTPPGCLAIAGLMGCPLWLWASRALPRGPWSHPLLGAVLAAGRLLAAGVEVWLVGAHLAALLRADVRDMQAAAAAGRQGQGQGLQGQGKAGLRETGEEEQEKEKEEEEQVGAVVGAGGAEEQAEEEAAAGVVRACVAAAGEKEGQGGEEGAKVAGAGRTSAEGGVRGAAGAGADAGADAGAGAGAPAGGGGQGQEQRGAQSPAGPEDVGDRAR